MQVAPTTAELTELRCRLYRPEPPDGCVEAYLRALAVVVPDPPAAEHVAERRPAPRRGRRALAALAAAACAVALVGALAGALAATDRATAQARAEARATAERLPVPEVPGAPVGHLAGERDATARFDGRSSRVVVSVLCSGSGVLTLRIADDPPTVLTCQSSGPALAMLTSAGPLRRFTVAVAPSGSIRWSLAAGAVHFAAS